MVRELIDEIRNPDYTGKNRCTPCTVLNFVIAALASSLIARRSRLAGAVGFGIASVLIYLRGYLLPGTPALTRRYLPPVVLQWFGKDTEPAVASGLGHVDPTESGGVDEYSEESAERAELSGRTHGVPADETEPVRTLDFETVFRNIGVLVPCDRGDDLCLTDAFRTNWETEMETLMQSEIDGTTAANAFGFDSERKEFHLTQRDEVHVLHTEATAIGQWPSLPALIADIAAAGLLSERHADWREYDPVQQGQLLNGLRLFLETCPTTGGNTYLDEEVVQSCCSSRRVIALTCEETGDRLFEHPVTERDGETRDTESASS